MNAVDRSDQMFGRTLSINELMFFHIIDIAKSNFQNNIECDI